MTGSDIIRAVYRYRMAAEAIRNPTSIGTRTLDAYVEHSATLNEVTPELLAADHGELADAIETEKSILDQRAALRRRGETTLHLDEPLTNVRTRIHATIHPAPQPAGGR